MTSIRKEILSLNNHRCEEFCAPAAIGARELFTNRYPTSILVFKCMDGRVHLPIITGIPLGILHPFRNIGGIFTLGDPYLGRLVQDARDGALREGRQTLALCTYHFSRDSKKRGCAGHNYDTEVAKEAAFTLKREFESIYGVNNATITAIVVGIETDEDVLVFCNGDGKSLSIADLLSEDDSLVEERLRDIYPNIDRSLLRDLTPLALGNRDHVSMIRQQGRPAAELYHGENIIAVGRGFDWFHFPNRALIIGPYSTRQRTWRDAISVAGEIVLDNFRHQPDLSNQGSLLLISAPYHSLAERGLAIAKTRYFAEVAGDVLSPKKEVLQLEKLIGVTDMTTMRFEPIE